MGTMNITIYGRDYPIACDDGQEAHLGKLAQAVNERLKILVQQMGRGPEVTMHIYALLMLADELYDAKKEISKLSNDLATITKGGKVPMDTTKLQEMEAAMAHSMHQIADRIEQLSAKLAA